MKKLLMLAIAAMAFLAIPASASANEFLHEGEPIGEAGVQTEYTGSAGFTLAADPTTGVHCESIHFVLLVKTVDATVIEATFVNCTTTSSNPEQNGLPTDASAINLANWTVTPDTANGRLVIDNVHINNKVTHPVTTHLVLSESTLKGTMTADVVGSTEAIETVELGDEGATVQFGIPPSGTEFEANVAGDLSGNGTIGLG